MYSLTLFSFLKIQESFQHCVSLYIFFLIKHFLCLFFNLHHAHAFLALQIFQFYYHQTSCLHYAVGMLTLCVKDSLTLFVNVKKSIICWNISVPREKFLPSDVNKDEIVHSKRSMKKKYFQLANWDLRLKADSEKIIKI